MFFYGNFEFISAASLLQALCQERRTVLISAWRGTVEASIHLFEGQIVDARCGDLRQTDAVCQVMSWDCGQFRLDPADTLVTKDSFVGDWEELALEAARRRDELELNNPPLPPGPSRQQLLTLLIACPAIAGIATAGYDGRLLAEVGVSDALLPYVTTLTSGLLSVGMALQQHRGVSLYINGGQKLLLADCGDQLIVLAVPAVNARVNDAISQLASILPRIRYQANEVVAGSVI